MKLKEFLLIACLMVVTLLSGCSFESTSQATLDLENRVLESIEKSKEMEDEAYYSFSVTNETVYYDALNRLLTPSTDNKEGMPFDESLLRGALRFYSTIRSLAPYILLVSIGIGVAIWLAARKNKTLRKLGIYGFIVGVPLFILLLVFGIGLFFDLLAHR